MCDELLDNIADDIDARVTVFDPDFAYSLFKTKINSFETQLLYVVAIINTKNQVSFYLADKTQMTNPDIVYTNVKIEERAYLLRVAEFTESSSLYDRPKRAILTQHRDAK